MNFTSIPDHFAPIGGGLVYEIQTEDGADAYVDVAVVNAATRQRAALCRFARTDRVRIDIAPYVRRMFAAAPAAGHTELFNNDGRVVRVVVEVNGEASPERRYTLFELDGVPRILSTMPFRRTLAFGECDELPFTAPMGGHVTVVAEDGGGVQTERLNLRVPVSLEPAVWVLRVAADDFDADTARLRVTVSTGSGRHEEVVYDMVTRPQGACRVAWLSAAGAVEHYTFPSRRRSTLAVERSRFCGEEGYTTVDIRAERSVLLVSDFETEAMAESLEEIVASPAVWIARSGVSVAVDVLSSESVRNHNGVPASVCVEVRSRNHHQTDLL